MIFSLSLTSSIKAQGVLWNCPCKSIPIMQACTKDLEQVTGANTAD